MKDKESRCLKRRVVGGGNVKSEYGPMHDTEGENIL